MRRTKEEAKEDEGSILPSRGANGLDSANPSSDLIKTLKSCLEVFALAAPNSLEYTMSLRKFADAISVLERTESEQRDTMKSPKDFGMKEWKTLEQQIRELWASRGLEVMSESFRATGAGEYKWIIQAREIPDRLASASGEERAKT